MRIVLRTWNTETKKVDETIIDNPHTNEIEICGVLIANVFDGAVQISAINRIRIEPSGQDNSFLVCGE